MARDEVMTGEGVGLEVRPVGFLLRAVGGLIDLLAVGLVLLALQALVNLTASSLDPAARTALSVVVLVVGVVVIPLAVELATGGRSLGRLVVGARIVRDDGGAEHFRQVFVRALTGAIEVYGTLGGLATLVVLLHPRAKRIGDILAGTFSQSERAPRVVPSGLALPPALAAWAQVADVAALPEALSRRIARFLAQAPAMTDASRLRLAAELADEASAHVSPLPAVDPWTFLVGVAVMRRERERRALEAEAARLEALAPVLEERQYR